MGMNSLVLAVLILASSVQAGVVLTMETVNGKVKTKTVAMVDGDRFRVDADGGKTIVIYRKDQDAFWMIDAGKKSYSELTRQDLEAMGKKMEGMMAQMEAQLKDLPEAQRAQMQAMMRGHMGGAGSAPTFRKLAAGRKVGKWTAVQYAMEVGGKKTGEVFHADPSVVGLTEADFAVFASLADTFKSMTQGLESAGFYRPGKPGDTTPAGVLVRSVRLDASGKPGSVSTLVSVARTAVAASEFEIPAGYKKEKSPMAEMDGHEGHGPGDGHDH